MPCLQELVITSLDGDFQLKADIDLSKSTQLRNLYLEGVNSSLWRTVMDTIHTQQLTELQLDLAPIITTMNTRIGT